MIRTGLVSVTFRQFSPRQIIQLAVQAGLEGIEWGGDIHVPHGNVNVAREVAELSAEHGLAVAAYGSYYRAGTSEEEGLSFEAVLEIAESLGAPTIRVWAGNKGSDESSPSQREAVVNDLQRIADLAMPAGISISMEYHKHTLTDTLKGAYCLLSTIGHPQLKTYWQPRLGTLPEESAMEIRTLLPWLSNIHVYHWRACDAHRLSLQEGEREWKTYFGELQESTKDRYALLEFVSGDTVEQLLQDASTLRNLLNIQAQF